MGGGTGTYTVLSSLKKYPINLKAIVAMTDDGGSTGVLRDELGVLPPGDIRQCLVALSEAPLALRNLFNYRFDKGGLKGHNFGNIFISALEKALKSFERGLEEIGKILRIKGEVIPVTLNNVRLVMTLKNGVVLRGERQITPSCFIQTAGIKKFCISPAPRPNPKAIHALRTADVIILGPGNLYASLLPLLLVSGIPVAVARSKAKKILIANLMTKEGQTEKFSVSDLTSTIAKYLGAAVRQAHRKNVFDCVLYNTEDPSRKILKSYLAEKSDPLLPPDTSNDPPTTYIGKPLISGTLVKTNKADSLIQKTQQRSVIRHDQDKLGKTLWQIITTRRK